VWVWGWWEREEAAEDEGEGDTLGLCLGTWLFKESSGLIRSD